MVRVLEDHLTAIEQAIGTPRARVHGARFLEVFIEHMKASGFVAAALARRGQRDAPVAPPAPPR